ncbi:DUF1616 domain-containing protein [Haloarchaeobius litoreus]|uniref:DUF1616 domain-containing protein n=1 Tax=Haloarchaeobius litoreus TaxID=755306 RepID=A0ABD6DN56_9EURY|nr:DUF1616 domain-containing protein [Haloarchaeobius litoreus]
MSDAHVGENAPAREPTRAESAPRYSYDLALLVGFVLVAAVLLAILDSVLLRTVIGVPVVTFAPGYALVTALLPVRASDATDPGSLDRIERLAVAVGASVALVVLGALLLAPLSPGGLAAVPFLELLVTWTVLGAGVGYIRRRNYPPERRDGVADPRTLVAEGRFDRLDVVLVLAMLVAVASVGHGLAAPGPDASHTTVTLVTENESGEYVAADYPRSVTVGESIDTSLLVDNGEGERTSYTVVAVVERIGPSEQVVQRSQLERVTLTVSADQRVVRELSVAPDLLGESLRLSFYVYEGEAPTNPSPEAAAHHLYLWLSVEETGDAADEAGDAADEGVDRDDEEGGDEERDEAGEDDDEERIARRTTDLDTTAFGSEGR